MSFFCKLYFMLTLLTYEKSIDIVLNYKKLLLFEKDV